MMDRTDYQILNLLQDDSRCTLRRMGDLVGLTPPAVSERIRRMEESGVIRGYHIDVDRTKLDCNITGFISVALEPDKYDKFCDFCASQSAIISHYHVVGEFNALLRFAVRDTQQLDQLLSLIKKFGDSRTSIELNINSGSFNTSGISFVLASDSRTYCKRSASWRFWILLAAARCRDLFSLVRKLYPSTRHRIISSITPCSNKDITKPV